MRTKTLLSAVAALAVSVATSMAQTTYSQNVVGYVNIVVSNGFNQITMPLDYDGTGTNNVVVTVIGTNLPVNSQILTWNNAASTFVANNYVKPKSGPVAWSIPGATYNPGQGIFINNPSNAVTITIVGTVLQGGLTNGYVHTGFSLVGGQFPVAGGISSTFGYIPSLNDQVLVWRQSAGTYVANNYVKPKSGPIAWSLGEPQLTVGQAVFLNTTNLNPVWGTNFIVQ